MNHLKSTMKYLLMLSIIFCGVFVSQVEAKNKSKPKPPPAQAVANPVPADATASPATVDATTDPVSADATVAPSTDATTDSVSTDATVAPSTDATTDPASADATVAPSTDATAGPVPSTDTVLNPMADPANNGGDVEFGNTWGNRPDVIAAANELHATHDQLEGFLGGVYNKYVDYTTDSKLNPEIKTKRQDSLKSLMSLAADFRKMFDLYSNAKENKDVTKESLIKVRNDFKLLYYPPDSGLGFDIMLKKRMVDIKGIDPDSAKCLEELDVNNVGLADIQAKIIAAKSAVIATLPQ